jgi:predicted DNA-binding antitoxin AbrB/MazE fold protein
MGRDIQVVYENGVFKPLEPVNLPEGERLTLYIPHEPDGLTTEQRLEKMREIQQAFADVSDEEWAEVEKAWKRGG